MSKMKKEYHKGEVIISHFPFSNLKSSIKRPAVVIANLKGEDLILCQITSKSHISDPYQINLGINDFSEVGLKRESFIKPSIIFTIRKSLILYYAGKVSEKKIKEVEEKICEIICG